jgi:hypothetical protein
MFQRERRYIVLKNKDVEKYLSGTDMLDLNRVCSKIAVGRFRDGRPEMQCVVVESDWPEYEPTWEAIKQRMESKDAEARRRGGK